MKLIKADLLIAQQGIELYKNREIKEIKNQAAYHLQQAAEKLIKYDIHFSIRINSLEKYHREISDWYEILYKKGIR